MSITISAHLKTFEYTKHSGTLKVTETMTNTTTTISITLTYYHYQ